MSTVKHRKNVGTILTVIGAVLLIFAFQMSHKVAEGEEKVANAAQQEKHPRVLRPVRAEMTRESNSSIQTKIQNAMIDIRENAELTIWFQLGGGSLVIVGLGMIFRRNRR